MRILITGGAGFVGRHVIDALVANWLADDVVILDSFEPVVHGPGPYPAEVEGFYTNRKVEVIRGNLCRIDDCRAAVSGVDVVLHLAAAVSVSDSFENPTRYIRDNALGTATLWQAIHAAGRHPHVVNISSMSVYGESGKTAVDERHPVQPMNVYALSKLNAELFSLVASGLYGCPVSNLRLFNVYGPGQALGNAETGVIAIWTAAMLAQQPAVLFEDGEQLRDFVYVTDVANAIVQCVKEPLHATVNIGTGVPSQLKDVVKHLAELTQAPCPEPTGTCRPGDTRYCFADIEKARKLLSFEPKIALADGLVRTVEWAKQEVVGSETSART